MASQELKFTRQELDREFQRQKSVARRIEELQKKLESLEAQELTASNIGDFFVGPRGELLIAAQVDKYEYRLIHLETGNRESDDNSIPEGFDRVDTGFGRDSINIEQIDQHGNVVDSWELVGQ